jgi:hypothetical protein
MYRHAVRALIRTLAFVQSKVFRDGERFPKIDWYLFQAELDLWDRYMRLPAPDRRDV